MMTPVDYQPPFVPKISVDTEDANPQRRQTEEISANEIAGTGELCAIDPGDDNFYNLRNVDDTKKSRKKEQQRIREERIQNNRLRKQQKIREAREIVDRARKAAEVLDANMLKFEAWRKKQRKQRLSKQEDDNYYGYRSGDEREREGVYTSEIINEPPSGSGEWLPYESDNEFGTAFELKRTSWGVEKFTLELARCMVGLESFTGDKQLFSCSGTIVEFLNDVGYVVTSASLVRCTYKDRIGVGGPLMDFDGNIIGMSFYDKKETPFLPSFIVLKCLQHFKNFGKVIRPLHGLRAKTLHEAQLTVLEEKIQHGLHGVCGVIVEKVEVPSAEHSEIRVGDIITHVDGVPFSNAAELGGILLDRCGKQMLDREKSNLSEDCNQMATVISFKFRVKTFRGGKSETTTRTINVDKFTPSGLNRWPLPRKIIELRKAYGVTFDEQWYTIEV